jgi:hypothetical protein
MPAPDVTLTPVPGATVRLNDDGNPIVEVATCGTCGRSCIDAAVSALTPVPAGRCPFEYEHPANDAPEGFRVIVMHVLVREHDADEVTHGLIDLACNDQSLGAYATDRALTTDDLTVFGPILDDHAEADDD